MLAEIRIGPGKFKLKGIMREVGRKCHVRRGKIHRVPHLTLYYLKSYLGAQGDTEIKNIVEKLGRNIEKPAYIIDGIKSMKGDKGWVIYFNVVPNESFDSFTKELRSKLREISPPIKNFDKSDKFVYHITLAYKLNDDEYRHIWDYLNTVDRYGKRISDIYMLLWATRFTMLGNTARIMYEYDFYQHKFLERYEALNRMVWARTLEAMRLKTGAQVDYVKKPSYKDKKAIWLISDTHFDHANIIGFSYRPFCSIEDMNNIMVRNWNNTVSKPDTVYILGDVDHWSNKRKECTLQELQKWTNQLNGDKVLIRSNHTPFGDDYATLNYNGIKFLLIHNPNPEAEENKKFKEVFKGFEGWIVHGDKHNMNLRKYPFINGERKTINICAELVNYTPLNIQELFKLDFESIKRMDTINSPPIRY